MKTSHTILAIVGVGLTGGAVLQYFSANSMEFQVQEATKRVERQEEKLDQTDSQVKDHEKRIDKEELVSQVQEVEITDLQKEVAVIRESMKKLEEVSKADRGELEKLRDKLDKINNRLAQEASNNKNFLKEIQQLSKQLEARLKKDLEIETRLKNIEEKVGIQPPES